jgi:hypothetical protein
MHKPASRSSAFVVAQKCLSLRSLRSLRSTKYRSSNRLCRQKRPVSPGGSQPLVCVILLPPRPCGRTPLIDSILQERAICKNPARNETTASSPVSLITRRGSGAKRSSGSGCRVSSSHGSCGISSHFSGAMRSNYTNGRPPQKGASLYGEWVGACCPVAPAGDGMPRSPIRAPRIRAPSCCLSPGLMSP